MVAHEDINDYLKKNEIKKCVFFNNEALGSTVIFSSIMTFRRETLRKIRYKTTICEAKGFFISKGNDKVRLVFESLDVFSCQSNPKSNKNIIEGRERVD